MTKIPSGTTARANEEWIGKTPNTEAPPRIKLRILARQGGKCAVTGHKFAPGDQKRLDHIKPVIDGGENRESNLQWILDAPHKEKTKTEARMRSKARGLASSHVGINPPPKRPIQSRGFPETKKPASGKLPIPSFPSALARRFRDDDK